MIGFGRWPMIMKFSPISNSSGILSIGTSSWPIAPKIWKFGGGSQSFLPPMASNLILLRSCSEIALAKTPVFVRLCEMWEMWVFQSPSACSTCGVAVLMLKRKKSEGMTGFIPVPTDYGKRNHRLKRVVLVHCNESVLFRDPLWWMCCELFGLGSILGVLVDLGVWSCQVHLAKVHNLTQGDVMLVRFLWCGGSWVGLCSHLLELYNYRVHLTLPLVSVVLMLLFWLSV